MRKIFWFVLYTALSLGANAAAADLEGLKAGDMRKLVVAAPKAMADGVFAQVDGVERSLAEYRGKVVVLNFWATWCAPCKKEMPSLARLQAAYPADQLAVVPVATGRNAPEAITRFFAEVGAQSLPILLDAKQDFARANGVFGLPATILIDKDGNERGRLLGEAAWDGPDARKIIDALLAE